MVPVALLNCCHAVVGQEQGGGPPKANVLEHNDKYDWDGGGKRGGVGKTIEMADFMPLKANIIILGLSGLD